MSEPGRPPDSLPRINTVTWRAVTPLHRVHRPRYAADAFNPCAGGASRFAPLFDHAGSCVPTLYAAADFTCAVHKSIFHDNPMVGTKSIRASRLDEFVYSEIVPRVDLVLASLTSEGLMQLDAFRALTECEANGYAESVLWAQRLHADNPRIAGLLWVSRRYNEGRAVILFGDRMTPGTFVVASGSVPLKFYQDEIDTIAARCDITINRR